VNPGAFLGSWFHWPPLPDNFEETLLSEPCNGIYISHLHPDHYDPKFIAKFTRLRPEVPIYIAEYAHEWLKRSIAAVAHKETKVIEIKPLQEMIIEDGFTLKVFAADTCNSIICGSNIPCQIDSKVRGIDSIGVFRADGAVVVNANDAMGVHLVNQVSANIGKADLIMGHYGGASPFPQCFPAVEDKHQKAAEVIHTTCRTLVSAAEAIDAKKIMPFAGQYILGGRLTSLNPSRATLPLDEAVELLKGMTDKEVLSVQPGGSIDLSEEWQDDAYSEPTEEEKNQYLLQIARAMFPYEKRKFEPWTEAAQQLLTAAAPVASRSRLTRIEIENSFVIGDGENFVTINLDPLQLRTSIESGIKPAFENVTTITMPPELLRSLSTRRTGYKGFTPMHWNQADVGSHFTWYRTGLYDLTSHSLLNFFGV
jgi:UDP-MurNAc hydroxylase